MDHFLPKSVHPNLAYEWTNYRLALEKINGYKGDSLDVLDPFHIQTGWFALDFATFFVHPEAGVRDSIRSQVQTTIDVLRLNEESLVELRYAAVRAYSRGDVTLDYLEQTYPFIAFELTRQGVAASILGTVP